jgi:hypothetical protein
MHIDGGISRHPAAALVKLPRIGGALPFQLMNTPENTDNDLCALSLSGIECLKRKIDYKSPLAVLSLH